MLEIHTVLLAVLGWAALTSPSVPAEHAPAVADTRRHVERLEKLGFSGVVLVARGGRPLLAQGYGLADWERDLPWTPATVSTVGSITKQFTGAAILLLQEEGRLSVSGHRRFAGRGRLGPDRPPGVRAPVSAAGTGVRPR